MSSCTLPNLRNHGSLVSSDLMAAYVSKSDVVRLEPVSAIPNHSNSIFKSNFAIEIFGDLATQQATRLKSFLKKELRLSSADSGTALLIKRISDGILAFLAAQSGPITEKKILKSVKGRRQGKVVALRALLAGKVRRVAGTGKRADPFLYSLAIESPEIIPVPKKSVEEWI